LNLFSPLIKGGWGEYATVNGEFTSPLKPPCHAHSHRSFAPDAAVKGVICQSVQLLNLHRIDIPKNSVADLSDTADKFTFNIGGDFGADIEKIGEDAIERQFADFDAAVFIPTAANAVENRFGGGKGSVVFSLPKGGGSGEGEGEDTIAIARLFVKLQIGAGVRPRLAGLGGSEDARNFQIRRSEMPGAIGVEVQPQVRKLAENVIIQEGNSPPTGRSGGD